MKTDRVTADGAVRTASATIAWFRLPLGSPTRRTRIGASTFVVGGTASAASVATRISASPDWTASCWARASASPRSPRPTVGRIESIACRTRPMSLVPVATILAVRPASMTLTLPPAGRSLSASLAASRAADSRSGGTSVAPMLADVSMMTTRSRASPAGRSTNGRAARRARITTSRSWRRKSRLRRSFCHGAFASTSAASRCQRRVDGTTVGVRRRRRRYIATTAGTNRRPSSASGALNGIVGGPGQATTRRRRSSAKISSLSGTSVERSTYVAWRRAASWAKPSFQAARRPL